MHLARDVQSVVITGTNGKTTSARMLEQFMIDSNRSYFANKSGSNLMQGITAEYALNSTLTGKAKKKYAIIECDEAASKKVFEYINPSVALVTNIFSDQLGVIGDIMATLENVKIGLMNSPNATICINADDSLSSSIPLELRNNIVYYGINSGVLEDSQDNSTDATHCLKCGEEYKYEHRTYGHLGGFYCPWCGYSRAKPDVAVTELYFQNANEQNVKIDTKDAVCGLTINLPGSYNIYNAAGVIAAALSLGFTLNDAILALGRFEGGFGRMEKFMLEGKEVRMILVKNTVGFNQVLSYLGSLEGDALLAICLNNQVADGTDISWLADVAFSKILDMADRVKGVYVSGACADDVSRCLEKAGLSMDSIRKFPDQGEMLTAALHQDAPVYIIPSYTAMMELRSDLSRRYGIKEYWE